MERLSVRTARVRASIWEVPSAAYNTRTCARVVVSAGTKTAKQILLLATTTSSRVIARSAKSRAAAVVMHAANAARSRKSAISAPSRTHWWNYELHNEK
eukprot:4849172-Prymnesium_polylepis.1